MKTMNEMNSSNKSIITGQPSLEDHKERFFSYSAQRSDKR